MFGSKKDSDNVSPQSGAHTLFDHELEVQGDVKFGGTLDVEGTVRGNITAEAGSDALVRIRERGEVHGEIRAPRVIINGQVCGDVFANKHLELASKAVVNGNVHYNVIEIVKGAQVNGKLLHVSDAPLALEMKPKEANVVENRKSASKNNVQSQSGSEVNKKSSERAQVG